MASQTSLVASQVRLHEWALQIQDCQNRPRGMDVQTWCDEHGITKANYYYRLKKVRQVMLDTVEASASGQLPSFVELQPVTSKQQNNEQQISSPIAATVAIHGTTFTITNDASAEFLQRLVGVLQYAQ